MMDAVHMEKHGRRCLAVPAINELPALSCCTLQQNTPEFSTPPVETSATHDDGDVDFFKVLLQYSEAKKNNLLKLYAWGLPPRRHSSGAGGVSRLGIVMIA